METEFEIILHDITENISLIHARRFLCRPRLKYGRKYTGRHTQIRIAVVKQLPPDTPTTTSNCTENIQYPWGLIIHSQNCEQKFIGKTNRLGQILLLENSHHAGKYKDHM